MFDDIKAFHEKFELQYNGPPRTLPEELAKFRIGFLAEELGEYCMDDEDRELLVDHAKHSSAIQNVPLDKQLDALVDLVYVALGNAYLQGFDFDEAWRRVHEANMKKVRAMRMIDSKRGSTYDVIKPQGWSPPDLSDLVSAVPNAPPASPSER
jgi:predicted HAD superfamily Cof-like phosphohydrolase